MVFDSELCIGTGQRIGDVLEMRWSDIQDGGFAIRQNKTSKELWIPILPELQAALDVASRHSVFLLTNERGTNRWSYRGASQAVRLVRDRINALDYDIHSWRYNAACELVEAGCGDEESNAAACKGAGRDHFAIIELAIHR
jgi:integrase